MVDGLAGANQPAGIIVRSQVGKEGLAEAVGEARDIDLAGWRGPPYPHHHPRIIANICSICQGALWWTGSVVETHSSPDLGGGDDGTDGALWDSVHLEPGGLSADCLLVRRATLIGPAA